MTPIPEDNHSPTWPGAESLRPQRPRTGDERTPLTAMPAHRGRGVARRHPDGAPDG